MADKTAFAYYTFEDSIAALRQLSDVSQFDLGHGTRADLARRQIRVVYTNGITNLLHSVLQMNQQQRVLLAKVLCGDRHEYSTAIGVESLFFSLATDPVSAKVLFDAAPLSQWLGRLNTPAPDRAAGAAVLDLGNLDRSPTSPPRYEYGWLLSPDTVTAVMAGGDLYVDAVAAGPDGLGRFLEGLKSATFYELDGKATVTPWDSLVEASAETEADVDSFAADQRPIVKPISEWGLKQWAQAFTAAAALIAVGGTLVALFVTEVTVALIVAFAAADLGADAALANFADGVLDKPSLRMLIQSLGVHELPMGIVYVGVGDFTLLIDGEPDATPPQPP
jgi:hypothetical protein